MKKIFTGFMILSVLFCIKSKVYAQNNSFNGSSINDIVDFDVNCFLSFHLFHANETRSDIVYEVGIFPNNRSMVGFINEAFFYKNWRNNSYKIGTNQKNKHVIASDNTRKTTYQNFGQTGNTFIKPFTNNSYWSTAAFNKNNKGLNQLLIIALISINMSETSASCTPPNCAPLWNGNN